MLCRKVLTKDRFPPVDTKVDSGKGDWWYNPNDPYVDHFPEYWYEEVTEPTEEEIENKAIEHPTPKIDNINLVAHESYTNGYKQALKDLKGE